jgi:hypothetical protein
LFLFPAVFADATLRGFFPAWSATYADAMYYDVFPDLFLMPLCDDN